MFAFGEGESMVVIKQAADGFYWDVRIDGPSPITEHDELMLDLETAKITAHSLAQWHFGQKAVKEPYVDLSHLVWTEEDGSTEPRAEDTSEFTEGSALPGSPGEYPFTK